MASVSSLDHDMRNLRMSRYTPQAANEVKTWIEASLNERLSTGDLLDGLKDGVVLCKLANMVLPPPGIRFKSSAMPFMQMENISHFLKACEMPPLNMPAHDRFLTVDLYESKDPAQVLQCLGAFSRQAHALRPDKFTSTIGPRKLGPVSPALSASNGWSAARSPSPTKSSAPPPSAARALSPNLTGGSNSSQGTVSSWSRKTDEGVTTPAWNIAQYGYMGGASQGNQGISFGARRQITSQAPQVPSLAEKERTRREKAEQEARAKQQAEEVERQRRSELEADEAREKIEEEKRWEDETNRLREAERRRVEEQKRQWAEEERHWKEEEEIRRKEEAELKAKLTPLEQAAAGSNSILRGQTLSEYQKEQNAVGAVDEETPEQKRVRELEQQLEEARERERQYQLEREERLKTDKTKDRSRPGTATAERPGSSRESEASWAPDEREYLRHQWQNSRENTPSKPATPVAARPLPTEPRKPVSPFARPLPQPTTTASSLSEVTPAPRASAGSERPLPTPGSTAVTPSRTDNFLANNAAPHDVKPVVSSSRETGDTALEQQQDRDRRLASQQKTKAGGWASKSLLEREMERERERQREWEANQNSIKDAPRDESEGSGLGQTWSIAQYGYMGGDNQGRGSSSGSGIDFGGRRQIVPPGSKPIGPRPQK